VIGPGVHEHASDHKDLARLKRVLPRHAGDRDAEQGSGDDVAFCYSIRGSGLVAGRACRCKECPARGPKRESV